MFVLLLGIALILGYITGLGGIYQQLIVVLVLVVGLVLWLIPKVGRFSGWFMPDYSPDTDFDGSDRNDSGVYEGGGVDAGV